MDEFDNGELLNKLDQKLAAKEPIEDIWEIDVLETAMIQNIPKLDPYKKKMLFQIMFGMQGDSPEKMQLDQIMLNHDKKFDEIKREQRIIRYALFAIATVAGIPEVFRFFGLG